MLTGYDLTRASPSSATFVRMRRRWLATALVLAPTGACSVLVDSSGLSGGAKTSAASDAASNDATTTDASTVVDSALADASALDGALSTWSDPSTSFCDDFERAVVTTRWDRTKNTGGVLETTPGGVTSATAFRAGSSGVQSDQYVYLEKSLPVATKNVRCEFDLFADPLPDVSDGHEVEYFVLQENRASGEPYLLYFNWYASSGQRKWNVGEFIAGKLDRSVPFTAVTEKWVHVVLDVADRAASVSVDNVVVGSLTDLTVVDQTSIEIRLGVSYASKGIAYSALFDNLVCRFGS